MYILNEYIVSALTECFAKVYKALGSICWLLEQPIGYLIFGKAGSYCRLINAHYHNFFFEKYVYEIFFKFKLFA